MPAETRMGLFASVRHALRNREMTQQAKERFKPPETASNFELERLSEEQRERERRVRRVRWGA